MGGNIMNSEFLLVNKKILPSYYELVIACRELIDGDKMSVSDACKKMNISRSTYYKYKDYIFYAKQSRGQMAIISMRVCNKKGILSQALNLIFSYHGDIITINQDMPIKNIAYINIGLNIDDLSVSISDLLLQIKKIEGVKLVELLAIE